MLPSEDPHQQLQIDEWKGLEMDLRNMMAQSFLVPGLGMS